MFCFLNVFSSAPVCLLSRPDSEENTFLILSFSSTPMLVIHAHARFVVGHFTAGPSHNLIRMSLGNIRYVDGTWRNSSHDQIQRRVDCVRVSLRLLRWGIGGGRGG